ncbi:hypothetical protein L2E47_34675, partial [Pseudomonas aeruginosa]|nr:hypothetical protein [Pseudomonas aeruginosa]
ERRRALAPEGKRTSLTPTQARTRQARDTAQGGMDSVRRADWSAGTRESLIYWNKKINLNIFKEYKYAAPYGSAFLVSTKVN